MLTIRRSSEKQVCGRKRFRRRAWAAWRTIKLEDTPRFIEDPFVRRTPKFRNFEFDFLSKSVDKENIFKEKLSTSRVSYNEEPSGIFLNKDHRSLFEVNEPSQAKKSSPESKRATSQ